MQKLLGMIKQASVGAVEADNPVRVRFATVIRTNPLEVAIEDRFMLSENFLIVPEQMTEFRISTDGREYVIRRGLEPGDKVILLRMQGGQQFIVLDRVVDGT